MRAVQLILLLVVASLSGCFAAFEYQGMTFTDGKYCGVRFGSQSANESLAHLLSTGVNWISVVVTKYQDTASSLEIFALYEPYHGNKYTYTTATEEELAMVVEAAHAQGVKVMLKPHIDLIHDDAHWRGDIGYNFTAIQWNQWFEEYWKEILEPYGKFSAKYGVEMLSLSCELIAAGLQEENWRRAVSKTREIYSGLLTNSANWGYPNATGGEITNITWWDAVDLIGVDEYGHLVPLKKETFPPSVDALINAWQPYVSQLGNLSQQYDRPVIFTEWGACSGAVGSCSPPSSDASEHYMANMYDAIFQVIEDNSEWLQGVFPWNWVTDASFGGPDNHCMSPAFKKAEASMRHQYGASNPSPPPLPSTPPVCTCTL